MIKKIFVILISLILFIFSCQKELEIEYPEIEPRLVVNCLFSPDSLFKVRIGQLLSVNDSISTFIIEDAECEIWEDGIFAENLQYTTDGFYVSETLVPEVGKAYTLNVRHLDFPDVIATDTVPERVSVSDAYFVLNTLYEPLNESYFHDINIRFQDNIATNDFYELKLLVKRGNTDDEDTQINSLLFTKTNDLTLLNTGLIEYEPASIPFTDKLFNGQNYFLSAYYTLPFAAYSDEGVSYNTHDLIVHFNSVSYQYYQYSRKMIIHIRNQESDIFEGIGDPVQMYSNIEKGYGIFAAYCPYIDTLHHESNW